MTTKNEHDEALAAAKENRIIIDLLKERDSALARLKTLTDLYGAFLVDLVPCDTSEAPGQYWVTSWLVNKIQAALNEVRNTAVVKREHVIEQCDQTIWCSVCKHTDWDEDSIPDECPGPPKRSVKTEGDE